MGSNKLTIIIKRIKKLKRRQPVWGERRPAVWLLNLYVGDYCGSFSISVGVELSGVPGTFSSFSSSSLSSSSGPSR